MPVTHVEPPRYLAILRSCLGNATVKILTGPRRCGKTTLLAEFKNELLATGLTQDQVLTFDLDKLAQAEFLDSEILIRQIERLRPQNKRVYVFIEEIQQSENLAQLVESLLKFADIEVYSTASNQAETRKLAASQCTVIQMFPLSFEEFRGAMQDGFSSREDFSRYAKLGSFPALAGHIDDDSFISPYYELLVESLMYRDVGLRFRLKNPLSLRRVVAYLAVTAGTPVSARSIAKILAAASGQTDISDITAGRYLQALVDCGMFVTADRYDIKQSRVMPGISKYYLTDPAMTPYITAMMERSVEQLLENIVFLELKRRYEHVYAGKIGTSEIDFVCRGENSGCYVQVAATGPVAPRLRPFRALRDRYPCLVITLDQSEMPENTGGVSVIPAVDWLLGERG